MITIYTIFLTNYSLSYQRKLYHYQQCYISILFLHRNTNLTCPNRHTVLSLRSVHPSTTVGHSVVHITYEHVVISKPVINRSEDIPKLPHCTCIFHHKQQVFSFSGGLTPFSASQIFSLFSL